MNNYLIPANSKKSMLILGLFTVTDLIIFGVGITISLLCMMIFELSSLLSIILVLSPGVIASFLVFPIPNYHNALTFLMSMFNFYTNRQRFVWKGWCFSYGESEKQVYKR